MVVKTTQAKQVVDVTEPIQSAVSRCGVEHGVVHVFAQHTTTAVTTADLDPGTDLDMLEAFEAMVPKLKFRHPHDPAHVPDHILSSLLGPSVTIPFEQGKLMLGTWQRIVLVEFNGPRERTVAVSCWPTPAKVID